MQTDTRLSATDSPSQAGLKRFPAHLATLLVAGLMIAQASAGSVINPILWGAATTIAGVNDVRTDGTLVRAFNIGASGASGVTDTTVNGVIFSAFAFPSAAQNQSSTIDGVNFMETNQIGELVSTNSIGYVSGAFSALPAEYKSLLGSAGGAGMPDDLILSIVGLTVGSNYLIQVWTNVSANNGFFKISETATLSQYNNSSSVSLDANVGNTLGGLGQYAVGTFQANNTNLAVAFTGISAPVINAFQLRQINAVPEPASALATAALLAGGLMLRRRRN